MISSTVHVVVLLTLSILVITRFREGFWTSKKTGEDEDGEDVVETSFSFSRLKYTLLWMLLALASGLGFLDSIGVL